MSEETIFSKIIQKEIPADVVLETETVLAFRDFNPQAPVHVLVIPKKAIRGIGDAVDIDQNVLGEMMLVAKQVAEKEGVSASGYRLVVNNGDDGGQEVPHLHIHVIGGRKMSWPPG